MTPCALHWWMNGHTTVFPPAWLLLNLTPHGQCILRSQKEELGTKAPSLSTPPSP